jgi:hypothetical protein
MKRVCFVSCGKNKASEKRPCSFLYTGDLFQKSFRLAKVSYDAVAILSAKHGMLQPDDVIAPYDLTLKTMAKRERALWARKVSAQIIARYPPEAWQYVYFAGADYTQGLPTGEHPMGKLSFGRRLQWLNQKLRTLD